MENRFYDRHSKTQAPYGRVQPPQNRAKFLDIHELMKKELASQVGPGENISQTGEFSLLNTTIDNVNLTQSVPQLPGTERTKATTTVVSPTKDPSTHSQDEGVYDTYIYCDSDNKDGASDITNGKIVFDAVSLNNSNPIDNIIEIQIGNFYVPEIALNTVSQPLYFFFKRVNILIEEMSAQAIYTSDFRFHFNMDVQAAGIANLLTPASNDGKFIFRKPFRDVNQLSFIFRAPTKLVQFPQDIFDFTAVGATAPARITLTQPHGLTVASSVTIFVRNFASNLENTDALMNSDDGHLVTVIDATTLEFAAIGDAGFDFTNPLYNGVTGTLTIGFRRIAFTMRFRSIVDTRTNRIVPV